MIRGVVLFIVLGSTPVVWSQEPGVATEDVLTVEQAVALAFTQNRQVENAALEEHHGATIAQLRTVEIGDIYRNTIAVTAGLKAEERIIVTGATLVSEGEVVRIIP